MAAQSKVKARAVELLDKLSPRGRKSALEFIEYLADREDVALPEDASEDRALVARVRRGDLTGTVTLAEARKQLRGRAPRTADV